MTHLFQRLFSVSCTNCEDIATTPLGLCLSCENEIARILRPMNHSDMIRGSWALGPYHGVLGALIRRGKYRPSKKVFHQLGCRMAHGCLDLPIFDAVVSVPMPLSRRWNRGFNQSMVLADEVSQFLEVPHVQPLKRLEFKEQAGRSLEDRQKKLIGRFALKSSQRHLPKRLLLVDDVCTTGATLNGCAMELYEGGVDEIYTCTLAHVQYG